MSSLKSIDRKKFEELFYMSGGYVMDFTNRTFEEYILETTGVQIYNGKYSSGGGSKANHLREFWKIENNYNVKRLNKELLKYWEATYLEKEDNHPEKSLYEKCLEINENLDQDSIEDHLQAIQSSPEEKDFTFLANSIRETILQNKPELALDRLHTYVVKFVRNLCDKYGIKYDKDKALHSYYGEYIKYLKIEGRIESEMTERILKTSISNLEAFNQVRNNQSLAHDNPILNYDESMLIFKNICGLVEFIQSIEKSQEKIEEKTEEYNIDISDVNDLPF